MRRKTKKFYLAPLFLVLSLLMVMGCGRAEDAPAGEDTAGDAIVIDKIPQATQEMNIENEAAQVSQPESVSENEVTVDAEELVEPEIEQPEAAADIPETKEENKLQIVFLGDSILDGHRDDTGIAYLTGVYCNANVYNLAIGGTTAALKADESAVYESWHSQCMQGVVHAICGNVDPAIFDGNHVREVFDSCDFTKTDYFVLEYGMNDFLSGIPLNDSDDIYDEHTYVGALRIAVANLKEHYPDAQIILCSPSYAQFWGKDGAYLGDGNMVNNGQGTLSEYYRVCGNVSYDNNTLFLNAYEGIGLNTYTAEEWLEDGIHLTKKGRKKYAEKLSELILDFEAQKNN